MLDEQSLCQWRNALSPLAWCPTNIVDTDIEFVVESAIFAKYSQRWPLLLDPHGVALKWLITAEKRLTVIHGSVEHSRIHCAIETAAPLGTSVLIKDLREEDLADAKAMVGLIPRRFEVRSMLSDAEALNKNSEINLSFKQKNNILIGCSASSKVAACHAEFRFYVTTQHHQISTADLIWDGREQLVVINFAHSHSALQMEMLSVIVSHEQTSLSKEGSNLVQQDTKNNQQIFELESEILTVLTETTRTDSTSILDDGPAIEKSHALMEEVRSLREQRSEMDSTKKDLYNAHKQYVPIAQAARVFFCAISDLIHVEAAYAFSLRWFIDSMLVCSLKQNVSSCVGFRTNSDVDFSKSVEGTIKNLACTLYCHVSRTILSKDRLLFALLLAARPHLARDAIGAAEWRFLLTGAAHSLDRAQLASSILSDVNMITGDDKTAVSLKLEEHENPAKMWLPDRQWNEMCSLATLPTFSGLIEEFEAQIKMWKRVHDAAEPYSQPLPRHWDADLRGVNRLCILRCLRPDQIANAVRAFIQTQLGEDFLNAPNINVDAIVAESPYLAPIVVTTTRANKAAAVNLVVGVALRLGRDLNHILLNSGRVCTTDAKFTRERSRGTWVLVQNPQLCPEYIMHLEEACLNSITADINKNFRLWCVMDVKHVLSINLLKAATKLVYEPPRGVRAVVLDLYKTALSHNPDFLSSCTRGNEFRRLFFALCICHAILRERGLYGSLGWNNTYNFEATDLILSSEQLVSLLDNYEDNFNAAPFSAIQLCVGDYIYGGHVVDRVDHRLLTLVLDRFCRSDVLRPGHALSSSGEFRMPLQDGSQASWLRTVESLPIAAPLEFLGLHESATIEKNKCETSALLLAVFLTEDSNRIGHSRPDPFKNILDRVNDILASIPTGLSPVQTIKPGNNYFMYAVLVQEISKYNRLLGAVEKTMSLISSALRGHQVLSVSTQVWAQAIGRDEIPSDWQRQSYLSNNKLTRYIHDLTPRFNFFSSWLQEVSPSVYWLSAFFFPHAFLSAIRLNHACQHCIDNIAVELICKFIPSNEVPATEEYLELANRGACVKGIYIQSARWDARRQGLVECLPKIQFAPAPLIWFKPVEATEFADPASLFACPLYRIATRRSIFSSEGLSTNFVMFINTPSPLPACHWVERGTAMLLQLDEQDT